MVKITGSVGSNGNNARADVVLIQDLINQCLLFFVPHEALKVTGEADTETVEAIVEFQRRVVKIDAPDGRIDPGGRTLEVLNSCVRDSFRPPSAISPTLTPSTGQKYTASPNEQVTTHTSPQAADVIRLLRAAWPELLETGARTLTAQFKVETGSGKYCFNWNLGNVKSGPDDLHMYLKNVWEVDSPEGAHAQVAKANGLGHVATAEEIKTRGWPCPPGRAIAVFSPPHAQCRFRAYPSLEEGAERWIKHHQHIAQRNPSYLAQLNAGDVPAVAHSLKQSGYYTADEAGYARNMTVAKQEIERALEPDRAIA
jgi:hypothetical protein